MNNLTTIENRLASWKPLEPSAALKRRIIASASLERKPSSTEGIFSMLFWINDLRRFSLTGASFCLVLLLCISQLDSLLRYNGSTDNRLTPLLSASLSNQSYSSYLNVEQVRWNAFSAPLAMNTTDATNPVDGPFSNVPPPFGFRLNGAEN